MGRMEPSEAHKASLDRQLHVRDVALLWITHVAILID